MEETDDSAGNQTAESAPVTDPNWWLTEAIQLSAAQTPTSPYREFTIKKRNGKDRVIKAPVPELKSLQRRLAKVLMFVAGGMPTCANAYIKRRSIKSMAAPHVGKSCIVKIDISDFFGSLTKPLICRALIRAKIHPEVIAAVKNLSFESGALPTGAPTSPVLSNIYAREYLDHRLTALCRHFKNNGKTRRFVEINFTRYSDDIVISSDLHDLPDIIPAVRKTIEKADLTVNEDKIKILRRSNRQTVCGVVTNEKMSAPRPKRNHLRGFLHALACAGLLVESPIGTQKIGRDALFAVPINIAKIRGEVEFCNFVNRSQAAKLSALLGVVEFIHFGKKLTTDDQLWELIRISEKTQCLEKIAQLMLL